MAAKARVDPSMIKSNEAVAKAKADNSGGCALLVRVPILVLMRWTDMFELAYAPLLGG